MAQVDPDVVVFTELYSADLSAWGAPDGFQVLGDPGVAVTALISERLGEYEIVSVDDSGATSGIVLAPTSSGSQSPRIVAVHLARMSVTGGTENWEYGLEWISDRCGANTVAVGDFNAAPINMPHGRLGDCVAAAPLAGSWPAVLPPVLGASIDNVLVGGKWQASHASTIAPEVSEADHRPVFVELVPRRAANWG